MSESACCTWHLAYRLRFVCCKLNLSCSAGQRDQGLHQVSAEEGAVYGSCCWQRRHDRQGALHQHSNEHQLFGVSIEKELAECSLPVHQEQHGQALQAVLDHHVTMPSCCDLSIDLSLHNKYTKGQLLLQSPKS